MRRDETRQDKTRNAKQSKLVPSPLRYILVDFKPKEEKEIGRERERREMQTQKKMQQIKL